MGFCVNRFLLLFCAVAITQHGLFLGPLFAHHVIIIAKRAFMVNPYFAQCLCGFCGLAGLACALSAGVKAVKITH